MKCSRFNPFLVYEAGICGRPNSSTKTPSWKQREGCLRKLGNDRPWTPRCTKPERTCQLVSPIWANELLKTVATLGWVWWIQEVSPSILHTGLINLTNIARMHGRGCVYRVYKCPSQGHSVPQRSGDRHLVCLSVTGHPLRDGRGIWGLIQVGVVIVQQQLITQSVQLWNQLHCHCRTGHTWFIRTITLLIFHYYLSLLQFLSYLHRTF